MPIESEALSATQEDIYYWMLNELRVRFKPGAQRYEQRATYEVPGNPELSMLQIQFGANDGFQFHPHVLTGQLLEDFLTEFEITHQAWTRGDITEYPVKVPIDRISRWKTRILQQTP